MGSNWPPLAQERVQVDLHLHTRYSDGDDDPTELAYRCAEAGLRIVSCTDHDTMAGVTEFRAAAAGWGIEVVPGCEITAAEGGRDRHCLIYFVDPADDQNQQRITEVRRAEIEWWRTWFDQAEQVGVAVSWQAAEQRFGSDRIAYIGDYLDFFLDAAAGDERFAQYPRGRHDELIQQWCRAGQPLHVPRPWRPSLGEVAQWAADAGGVAVLAHPVREFATDELPVLLATLAEAGFAGLEAWTTWHSPADSARVAAACAAAGLVATQGSDYHGARLKPWAPAPGLVPAVCPDPWAVLDMLEAARPVGRMPGRAQ